ncbi:MMS19 nucleotide excision repair protein homolog isoform X1 [Tanacetum coccineum]
MRAVADSFSDSKDCLNKRLHATILPLYKQRLLSMVMLILQSSVVKFDSRVTRYMLHKALTHVITNTPLSAIMGEANKLVCEMAILCLTDMSELPYVTIYRFSTEVLQALSRALDYPKRSVRQEACYTSAVLSRR